MTNDEKPNVEVPTVVSNPAVAALIQGTSPSEPPKDDERFWHIVYRIGALVAITALIVAAVAGVIAWSASTQGAANQRATAAQSKCINTLLGDRGGLLVSLINELVDESKSQSTALKNLLSATSPQSAETAATAYQAAEDTFTTKTTALIKYANDHPLGKC